MLEKRIDLGVSPQSAPGEMLDDSLRGLSFCVTGTSSEPREVIHAKIQALGGEIHSAVKQSTHSLITSEKVGKAKIENAQKRAT